MSIVVSHAGYEAIREYAFVVPRAPVRPVLGPTQLLLLHLRVYLRYVRLVILQLRRHMRPMVVPQLAYRGYYRLIQWVLKRGWS